MVDRISPKARSALMARVKQRNTAPEIVVRSLLHADGYRYRLKAPKLPGRPDIIFPGRKKVVFVHGCFWHGHHCKRGKLPASNLDFWRDKISKNKSRDARSVKELEQLGWSALTVWECETKSSDQLLRTLAVFLEQT